MELLKSLRKNYFIMVKSMLQCAKEIFNSHKGSIPIRKTLPINFKIINLGYFV